MNILLRYKDKEVFLNYNDLKELLVSLGLPHKKHLHNLEIFGKEKDIILNYESTSLNKESYNRIVSTNFRGDINDK